MLPIRAFAHEEACAAHATLGEARQEIAALDPRLRPPPELAARAAEVRGPGAVQALVGRLPQRLGNDAKLRSVHSDPLGLRHADFDLGIFPVLPARLAVHEAACIRAYVSL